MKTNVRFWLYLPRSSLEWEIWHKQIVDKFKTQILFSVLFFFENRAMYERMWINIVEPEKPQMTVTFARAH
jgi:hypothetical protein